MYQMRKRLIISDEPFQIGATHEVRTRDLNLGKVALYQLS
ncbi:Oligoribonuclease (Modular protein) [Vibrio chagasii]|nr:Oligoribonuclease (Modular protein) [Vibrio chagasii]CAH6896089.1 Oligoribonuclease (Modular protein) [Vibrio chagasii]CAH6908697.1 Oligoribonuclease (Modular protein) [Vibrio chagasii]CAH7211426.1 Oligoribonuclease (Modular protein) [Vibrio chagasii]CAH7244615.1 Oligoribonuclease (Modular protein) [Vibrio chagasii]